VPAVATIATGGSETVIGGGGAVGSDVAAWIVGSGAVQALIGGLALAAVVESGGTQSVAAGGVASATLLVSGGTQVVSSGARRRHEPARRDQRNGVVRRHDTAAKILGGGTGQSVRGWRSARWCPVAAESVVAGGSAADTLVLSGGAEIVAAGGTAADVAIIGGRLELAAATAALLGSARFAGSGGILQIDTTSMPSAILSGFALGDSIVLQALAADGRDTLGIAGAAVTSVRRRRRTRCTSPVPAPTSSC